SFTLLRGERIAIIGANGTGKTTLLKTLLGKHPQSSGKLIMGGGVKASCLEQNLYGVRSKNPLEYIWDLYPSVSQLEVRSLLASVGFRGEEIYTDSKGLSGG
ncbi:MAG: ATP-binding cassette domain-containing protein, partial [Oscillospiraceae bacterium]